ncbi:Hypothetical protein PBC10988_34770 [Planctomycetales bacterium 10988]|nr:Hypothetical protein PBC10988_34770 [Planctomycetales bacterium 10988]
MSTTLNETTSTVSITPSERMQATMAAARVRFTWLGVRKSLNTQQKKRAADSFGAEGSFLSANKKLIDTSHPAYKAVTAIRSRAVHYWKSISLPFPEPGLRLIRQTAIDEFDYRMSEYRGDLEEAVAELDQHYEELRSAAQRRLGELFNSADYPPSLIGMFAIEHDYPSVEPPAYLRQLNSALYTQECQRMQSRFEEAVQFAEQAFIEELSKLVEHLHERLSGQVDGKPKVFRDSAVTNFTEFFDRFRSLSVRSNEELDAFVAQAQSILRGVQPHQLRDNDSLRDRIAGQLSEVRGSLDDLLVDRPRRNILRKPR